MRASTAGRQLRAALIIGLTAAGIAAALAQRRSFGGEAPVAGLVPVEALVAGRASPWEKAELWSFDQRAQLAAPRRAASGDILLVAIDDESLRWVSESYTLGWPWPRALVGQALAEIKALGARLVVLDLTYETPSPRDQSDDYQLGESVLAAGNVVLALTLEPRPAAPAEIGEVGGFGFRVGQLPDRHQALARAAEILALLGRPYLRQVGSGYEVYVGGMASEAQARGQIARFREGLAGSVPGASVCSLPPDARPLTREELVAEKGSVAVGGVGSRIPEFGGMVAPIEPLLKGARRFGAVGQYADGDGILRRLWPLEAHGGRIYPSLALAAALELLGSPALELGPRGLRVGDHLLPLDERGAAILHFASEGTYPRVPMWRVLANALSRERGEALDAELAGRFRGKAVLMAGTARALTDLKATPVGDACPGTVIVANALDDILTGRAVWRLGPRADAAICALMALIGALLAYGLGRAMGSGRSMLLWAALVVALGIGYLGAAYHAYLWRGLWIAVVLPFGAYWSSLLAIGLFGFVENHRERRAIESALGKYTSPAIVARVLENPEYLALDGEQRVMTVYFSDIRGFTTLSEGMPPKRLVALLEEYLTHQTNLVLESEGYVDKFIGDAIMAFWGAPVPTEDHAVKACLTALRMRDGLAHIREDWKRRFGVELYARAGLSTGEMVVGNMGPSRKLNYTVMGDAVNLASRLEGANKAYGTEILLAEQTFLSAARHIEAREVDLVRVKGKSRPVRIYELMAEKGKLAQPQRALRSTFEAGLAAYRGRRFPEAEHFFREALAMLPQDGPSQVYLERCAAFQAHPPPADWDGVFEMHEK